MGDATNLAVTSLDEIARAEVFDDVLTWRIKSRSDPHVTYVAEIGDFNGNGACACDDHKFNHAPILSRGIDAETAVDRGLVKWPLKTRPYQVRKSDALRCAHIMEARDQACSHFVRAFDAARKKIRSAQNSG